VLDLPQIKKPEALAEDVSVEALRQQKTLD